MLARWVWVGVLSSACGGSAPAGADGAVLESGTLDAGVDAGSDAGPPPTPEEVFLDEYDRLRCAYAVRCASPTVIGQPDDLECHPSIESEWGASARDAAGDGRVAFHADAAAACLAALMTPPPSCHKPDWDACARVFTGNVADGEACIGSSPRECMPWSRCVREDIDAPGTCQRLSELGGPCAFAGDCLDPLEVACREGVCVRLGEVGSSCVDDFGCAYELACVDGSCIEPYEGAPCMYRCGPDLSCRDGLCVPRLPEGSDCSASDGPSCASDTMCIGEPRLCRALDGPDEGDACLLFPETIGDACTSPLVCLGESLSWIALGVCVPGRALGAACDASNPCVKGTRCVESRCVRVVLPDEPCSAEAVCPAGFRCDRGSCVALPAPAQRCTPDVGCLAGTCVGGICCLAPEWAPCEDDPSILGMCETRCLSDGMCGPPAECDPACAGQSCWRDPAECVPRCPGP